MDCSLNRIDFIKEIANISDDEIDVMEIMDIIDHLYPSRKEFFEDVIESMGNEDLFDYFDMMS